MSQSDTPTTVPLDGMVRLPLKAMPGSDGYYLQAPNVPMTELSKQPEPLWFEKLENANASAVAMAERTGWAVYVVRVVSKVVPWHQR